MALLASPFNLLSEFMNPFDMHVCIHNEIDCFLYTNEFPSLLAKMMNFEGPETCFRLNVE